MSTRFITFEGADGSGKSTHLRRIADWLAAHGIDLVTTREPGGTAVGQEIRRLFLGGDETFDGGVEALLVFAARRQHLSEVIEPQLAAGRHVLCDRFTDSTLAYQGFGRGFPMEELLALDRLATGGRRPDRTLLFDLPPETARRRGRSDKRQRHELVNRLDAEDLDFYRRIREGYLELAAAEPERFRVIDSAGEVEVTQAAARSALVDLFPEAG